MATLSEEQVSTIAENQKPTPDRNNNIKLKIIALRNGLIEEKNKNKRIQEENEGLQKEIEELKKSNSEMSTKSKELEEENQKIKLENVTKKTISSKTR